MSPLLEFAKANHRQDLENALGPDGMIEERPITEAPDDARFYRIEHLDYANVLAFWFRSGARSGEQRYCALVLATR